MNDLVLKSRRVLRPSQGNDRVTDVAFAKGHVAAIGDNLAGPEGDVTDSIVTPRLIDLQTQV